MIDEPEVGDRIFYHETGIIAECEVMMTDHEDGGFGMELRPLRTLPDLVRLVVPMLPVFHCWRAAGVGSAYGAWTIDHGEFLAPEVRGSMVNVTGAPLDPT